MSLSSEVISRLAGKTLVTAESLTGGGIGAELTSVPGASMVYKGGIMSYVNEVKADIAVSVTGLAGPGGDEFGHPVGTVYIGYESSSKSLVKEYRFQGNREAVRRQTIEAALSLILEQNP